MLVLLLSSALFGLGSEAQEALAHPGALAAPAHQATTPTTLEIANQCTGQPKDSPSGGIPSDIPFVEWGVQHPAACYLQLRTPLPRSPEDSALLGPAIPYIWVDIEDMAGGCYDPPPGPFTPPELFLRITGADKVRIDSRPERGKIEENNWSSEGWGPWTQVYSSPVVPGQILRVPFSQLTSGAITSFEVRISAGDEVRQLGVSFPAVC